MELQLGENMSKSPSRPAAVQAQDEAADRLVEEAYGQPTVDPVPPAPVTAADQPVVEPPVAEPPVENWQQKFLTLQGKYNAEVPRYQADIRRLTEELQAAKAAPPPAPAPAPPAPEPPPSLVTDKDVAEFGADLVDLIRRASQEGNAGVKADLLAQIADLKSQLPDLQSRVKETEEVAAGTARASYFADLGKLVPDYEAINVDEAFIGWLTLKDPMSGVIRNELLQTAFNNYDVTRTAVVFNAYKAETGLTTKVPEAAPPRSELEREISPTTSHSPAPAATTDDKRVWTGQEVQEVYNAIARGDYRSAPAEAARLDKLIDQAFAEGRVRQ